MIKPINDIQAINNKPKEPFSLSKWNLNWKSSRRRENEWKQKLEEEEEKKEEYKNNDEQNCLIIYLKKNK